MFTDRITVVGLGPGHRGSLTVDALEALRAATRLYFFTQHAPIVHEIRGDLQPGAKVGSFDDVAATAASPESAAEQIAETLLAAAELDPICYAVPGHPLFGHRSVRMLIEGAEAHGIGVRIVDGLTHLEPTLTALRLAVSPDGLQIADACDIAARGLATRDIDVRDGDTARGLQLRWTGSSVRLLNAQLPLLVGSIRDEQTLLAVANELLERYPADHPVTLLREAGSATQTVRAAPLGQLDAVGMGVSGQAALYVPALTPLDDARTPNTLGYITARLRAPGGCPWDREQTHASLTPYMIEEAYEAVDAVERGDDADMAEELGDVLLQVVLHSQLAEEEGRFSLTDVAEEVNRKLVRRHPHVFGDVSVSGSSEVLRNWEQIKRVEKSERRSSALDGIPRALPALSLAQTIGRKAAKVGFDWPDAEGVVAKVREELAELEHAAGAEERREEMGDLLFALTSLCRHLGIDAEETLRAAARKFGERLRRVEALARERRLDLATMSATELDALWVEAKVHERG